MGTIPIWVTDPTGNNNPFLKIKTFPQGAVKIDLNSFLDGSSASTTTFTQGVLSFWMNYDSTVSAKGDSAKIMQILGRAGHPPANGSLLNCVTNPLSPTDHIAPPLAPVACVALTADPLQMNLVIQDGTTGKALVSVAVPYDAGSSYTSPPGCWINMGDFVGLIHKIPYTFNGSSNSSPVGDYGLVTACGATVPSAANLDAQICGGGMFLHQNTGQLSDPSTFSLPPELVETGFNNENVSPDNILNTLADVYVQESPTQVTVHPNSGWHHYIFSFDTNQLVHDQTGALCLRVQCAVDRGGGPITGGPLFDTAATSVGATSQPYEATNGSQTEQKGVTGTLSVGLDDLWRIAAPVDSPVQFAYVYFGTTKDNTFFDLKVSDNLDLFVSSDLKARDLFNITSLTPIFMHDGDTSNFAKNDVGGDDWILSGSWSDISPPPFTE